VLGCGHALPAAEVDPDPTGSRIGHGCHRCCCLSSGVGSASRRGALVVNEPVAPADIIVVAPDSGGAGALEAADLMQSGIATRVAFFADPPSAEDHEFIRRGLPYEDEASRQIR
jgi:hypothetical protein